METKTRRNSKRQSRAAAPAKSQQGFATAWREGTHAHRGKVVLSFFLAFLLCTMQPSGYSLYKAWGGEGSAALDGAFQAQAADTDYTVGVANMVAQSVQREITVQAGTLNPDTATYNSTIVYYANAADAPAKASYGKDTGEVGTAYMDQTRPTVITNDVRIVDYRTNDNDWPILDSDTETETNKPEARPDLGMFGVPNLSTYTQTFDTTTEFAQPFEMLGYEFIKWGVMRGLYDPEHLIPTTVVDAKGKTGLKAWEGDVVDSFVPYVVLRGAGPGNLVYATDVSTSGGKYVDRYAFAQWEPIKSYTVHFLARTSATATKTFADDVPNLSWDSTFTVPTTSKLFTKANNLPLWQNVMSSDDIIWRTLDKNGAVTDNGFMGGTTQFWQAVNSSGVLDMTLDPAKADNIYNDSGNGEISVLPYMGVQYFPGSVADSNTGMTYYATGGTTDWFALHFTSSTKGTDSEYIKGNAATNNTASWDGVYGANSGDYKVQNLTGAKITAPSDAPAGYTITPKTKNGKQVYYRLVDGAWETSGGVVKEYTADMTLFSGNASTSYQLYAQWELTPDEGSKSISLDYGPGTYDGHKAGASTKTETLSDVSAGDPLPAGALTGYTFIGWTREGETATDFVIPGGGTRADYQAGLYYTSIPSDVKDGDKFHAVYDVTDTLTFKSADETMGTVDNAGGTQILRVTGQTTAGVDFNDLSESLRKSTATAKAGYVFDKWTVELEKNASSIVTQDPGAGFTEPTTEDLVVTLDMWNTNKTSGNYGNTTFVANFVPQYTVTWSAEGGSLNDGVQPLTVKSGYTISDEDVPAASSPNAGAGYNMPVTWYKKVNGGTETALSGTPEGETITADTEFIAKYTATNPVATFALAEDYTNDGLSLGPTAKLTQTVTYNSAVNSSASALPTLTVPSDKQVKYTGSLDSTAPWSPALSTPLTSNTTFYAQPELRTFKVVVAVNGGKFSDGTTTHEYTGVAYGSQTTGISNLTTDIAGITANAGYTKTGATWTSSNTTGGDDPTSGGTTVAPSAIGDVTYTYTLVETIPTATFKLADKVGNVDIDDLQLAGTTEAGDSVSQVLSGYNKPVSSVPGLATPYNTAKYTDTITWKIEGDTSGVTYSSADLLNLKLKDNTTFVGTPGLKDVPLTFVVSGGTWADNTTADITNVSVKYGEAISGYPTNMKADSTHVQSSGAWDTDPSTVSSFSGSPTTFTYTFQQKVTDTYKIVGGYWGDGSTEITSEGLSGGASSIPDTSAVSAGSGKTTEGTWDVTPTGTLKGATYTYTLKDAVNVTFAIEGGSWSSNASDTANKTAIVSEGGTIASADIPAEANMKNAAGYDTTGKWYDGNTEVDINTVTVSESKTFTYKFNKGKTTYTVRVHKQNVNADNTVGTADSDYATPSTSDGTLYVSGQLDTGSTVSWKTIKQNGGIASAPAGFSKSSVRVSSDAGVTDDDATVTLSGDPAENVFDFYYDRNKYTVTYTMGNSPSADTAATPSDAVAPVDSTEYYYGAPVTVAAIPTTNVTGASGYTFTGWYLEGSTATKYGPESGSTATFDMPVPSSGTSVTLSGTWSRDPVTISFIVKPDTTDGWLDNSNYEGSTKVKTQGTITIERKVGDTIKFPATVAGDTGYFRHWTTDNTSADNDIVTSTEDFVALTSVEYYAWFDSKVLVSYSPGIDMSGGTFTAQTTLFTPPATNPADSFPRPTVAFGTYSITANKAAEDGRNTGYVFKGWENSSLSTPGYGMGADGDPLDAYIKAFTASSTTSYEFTAVYEGRTHKVYFDLDGGTLDSGFTAIGKDRDNAVDYKTGDQVSLPSTSQLTRAGYNLTGFTIAEDRTDGTQATYNGSYTAGGNFKVLAADDEDNVYIKVTPTWTPKTHSITYRYTADAGSPTFGTLPAKVNSQNVDSEVTIATQADAPDGYDWAGWTVKQSDGTAVTVTDNKFTMPDADVVITGTYNIKKFTVSYQLAETYAGTPATTLSKTQDTDVNWGTTGRTLTSAVSLNSYDSAKWKSAISWAPSTETASNVDANGKIIGDVTYVGTLSPATYTVRVVVKNGTLNSSSTGTSGVIVANDVPYGTKVSAVSFVENLLGSGTTVTWAAIQNAMAGDPNTTAVGWVDSSGNTTAAADPTQATDSDTITGNRTYTYEYRTARTVTFKVVNGTWTDIIGDTISFQVADGATIPATQISAVNVSSGTNKPNPATGYQSTGSWVGGAPDSTTPITANATYTYKYEPNDYKYQIVKHYQSATDESDYTTDTVTTTSTSGVAFGTTLAATSLSSAEYNAGKTGFGNAHVSNSTVTSTASIPIGATEADNVFHFYYDREKYRVTYQWDGTAPASAKLPADQPVRYGQENIAVTNGYLKYSDDSVTRDEINGSAFTGWYLSTDTGDPKTIVSTIAGPIADDVILKGSWATAQYDVKYQVSAAIDTSTYAQGAGNASQTLTGDPFKLTLSSTTDTTVTGKTTYGTAADAPTVVITDDSIANPMGGANAKGNDQYELDYWSYNTTGNTTDQNSDTELAADADPSSITVTGPNYVFTAHFKLKTFNVVYNAGDHGVALTQTEGKTKWTGLKYGEATPEPSADDINDNGGADGKVVVRDSDKDGYDLASGDWYWSPAKADRVTESVTYKAQFADKLYKVVFKNYDDSTLASAAFDDATAFSGENADLKWNESIFKNLAAAKAPTKTGAQFIGWHAAAVNADGTTGAGIAGGTLQGDTNGDVTVSALFAASSSYSPTDTLYVWAEWDNNPATLTYHSNYDPDKTIVKSGYKVDDEPALLANTVLAAGTETDASAFTRQGYTFLGWTTNTTAHDFDATNNAYDYAAGAKFALTTDTTSGGTNDVYAVWKADEYTVQWLDGDGNVMSYTQTITFDGSATYVLDAMKTAIDAAKPSTDSSAVFTNWTVDSDGNTVADAGNLTQAQVLASAAKNNVITLAPNWAGKIRLTFNDGVATEAIAVPDDMQASIGNGTDPAKATFTLDKDADNMQPTRTGYTFAGWEIGGTTYTFDSTDDITVNLDANAVATAQWTPGLSSYKVQRFFEQTFGQEDYPDEPATGDEYTLWGTTDATGTLKGKASNSASAEDLEIEEQVDGWELTTPTTAQGWTTTIYSDGSGVIKLYYRQKAYTVSYAFTGVETADQSKADMAIATMLAPSGATNPVAVHTGDSYEFPDPVLPEGYEPASSTQSEEWQYTKLNGDATATGDATKIDSVTGDTTVEFAVKKKEFTVTYTVDDQYGKWSGFDDDAAGAKTARTETGVKYGASPTMYDDNSQQVVATYLDSTMDGAVVKFALAGWAVVNDDGTYDATDLVNPLSYEVKEDTTFIAVFKSVHVVSYLPGEHALKDFKGDAANNKVSYDGLGATTAGKYTAAEAALVLSDEEWADKANGVPAAEPGWEFAGWLVSKDGSIPTSAEPTLPLTATDNDSDYVFTASWTETTQRVEFDWGEHPGFPSTATGVTGKTNAAENAPENHGAAAYYKFAGWKRTDENSDITMPATLADEGAFNIPAKNGVVYTAQYDPTTVDFKYQSADESQGIVSKSGDANVPQLDDPDKYYVSALPKAGYEFDYWTATGVDASDWSLTDETLVVEKVDDGQGNSVYQAATFTAHFKAITPKVTFVLDDSTKDWGTLQVKYADGKTYQEVAFNGKPTTGGALTDGAYVIWEANEGYDVDEWTYEMAESRDDGKFETVTGSGVVDPNAVTIKGDTVFKLKFKVGTSTLAFDGNGGTGLVASKSGTTGTDVTLPQNGFSRPGYTFKGWATSSDATTPGYQPDDSFKLGTATKLYAVWDSAQVSIEYNSNYPATAAEDNGTTLPAAVKATVPTAYGVDATAADPTALSTPINPKGYYRTSSLFVPSDAVEFAGWATDPSATTPLFKKGETIPGSLLELNEGDSLVLYAVWQDKKFKVTFNGNGATHLKGESTYKEMDTIPDIVYGETVNIPQNLYERENYQFVNWNVMPSMTNSPMTVGDSAGNPTSFTLMRASDVELAPNWSLDPSAVANVKVRYYDDKDQAMDPAERTGQTTTDKPLASYTVPTRDHFSFGGWYAASARTAAQKLGDNDTVGAILAKYYDASSDDYLGTTAYWDGSNFAADWPEGKKGDDVVTIDVYATYVMDDYTVHYDANAPAGYTSADVTAIDDDTFTVGTSKATTSDTYAFDGYKFLGWVNGEAVSPIMTKAAYNALPETKDGLPYRIDGTYTTSTGNELINIDGTAAETTLYAVWEAIPNTVTFMNRFVGDGLSNTDAQYDQTVNLTWTSAIELTTDIGDPRRYGSPYDDYVFQGWYAVPTSSTNSTVTLADCIPITRGTTQLGTVVKALKDKGYDAGYNSADGSYDVKVYAVYAKNGIKLVYHAGVSSYGDVPSTQTILVGDSPEAITLSTNALHKYGYIARGWTTQNPAEVAGERAWNVTNGSFVRDSGNHMNNDAAGYNGGTSYTPDANQRTDVDLYPAYEPRYYTVNYEYQTVDGYPDYATGLKKATYERDEADVSIDTYGDATGNVEWSTSDLDGYGIPAASNPTLSGYRFTGWYYGKTAATATSKISSGTEFGDVLDAIDGDDQTDTSITLYAGWEPETFMVSYSLGGGQYDGNNVLAAKDRLSWTDTEKDGQPLVPDETKLSRAGYTSGSWYIDSSKTTKVAYDSVNPLSYAKLAAEYQRVTGTTDIPGEITLYAGFEQNSVTITYRVGDTAHSYLASGGGVNFADEPTSLVITAGAGDGAITAIKAYKGGVETDIAVPDGATLSTYEVVAASATGYEADGWTPPENDGNEPNTTGDNIALDKKTGSDAYANGTYVYGVSSGATSFTVRYYEQKADGLGYDGPDSSRHDGTVGEEVLASTYDVAKTGFHLNEDASDTSITLVADDAENVLNLYYDRNAHDVVFKDFEWEGGTAGAATLPDTLEDQLYGSQPAIEDMDDVDGFEFDGWYECDENGENRSNTKIADPFTMPDNDVYLIGVWKKAAEQPLKVDFTGVFDEDGNSVSSALMQKKSGYTFPVEVAKGMTLLDTDPDFNIQAHDAAVSDPLDADAEIVVTYNSSSLSVSWRYQDGTDTNGDPVWVYVEDPTTMTIEKDVTFQAIISSAPIVTSSLLEFDLNTVDKDGTTLHQAAEWTDSGKTAEYDKQTRHNAGVAVALPSIDDATCDGYELKAWVLETTDSDGNPEVKRYTPGTSQFIMPAGADEDVFTLVAEWEEIQVTITYESADTDMGRVLNAQDKGGVWSLDPAGSEPVAEAGYEFAGWTLEDGTPVTAGVDATTNALDPSPTGENGKWADITYIATFKGVPCVVTFTSEDRAKGIIADENGDEVANSLFTTNIDYGTKPSAELMAGLVATPNRGYLLDGPDYWTYEIRDLTTGDVVKSGETDDPTKVAIEGNTTFTAHFKTNDLEYTVKYDTTGSDYDPNGDELTPATASGSVFADKTVGWNSVGLGNDASGDELVPVKAGYEFLGWFDESGAQVDEENTHYSDVAADESTESITLHAHWQMRSPYTLYFDPNGGGDAQAVGQDNTNKLEGLWWNTPVNGSDEQFQMSDSEWLGHEFLGWFTDATSGTLVIGPLGETPAAVPYSDIAGTNDNVNADITVYAHWKEKDYTVDYLDAVTGGSLKDSLTKQYSGSVAHDPLADEDTRTFDKWVYLNGDDEMVEVVSGETPTTVASMIADGAEPNADGHFQVYALWKNLYKVTTTYVPYLYNEDTGAYEEVTGTDWYERFPDNLVKTETMEEAGTAMAWQVRHPDYKVPGFLYDPAEAVLADPTFDVANLTVEGVDGDVEFFIPVIARLDVAKHEYKVHYVMNDDEVFPAGQLPSNDEYADKVQKSFANDDNIPTDENKVPLVPTRPGFRFDKWVNSLDWVKDTDKGYMEPEESTLYGDLAVRQDGTWYDPEDDPDFPGVVNLYAKWNEKQHKVLYQVSADRPGGEIRLNADSDPDFSSAQREETIGAATGESSPDVLAVGAIAQAKRGYTFDRWTVYSAKGDTITDILSGRSPMVTSAVEEIAMAAQSVAPAAVKAVPGMTAQAETTSEYSTNEAIMPGVNEAGLFAGLDEDPTDGESDDVVYTAEFRQNPMAKVTFDKGESDEYTGDPGYEQPIGTYVGETSDPDWGDTPGKLPGADTLKRDGYTFKGWKDKATGTVYDPDSDAAKSIVVPEGGIEFEPVWEKNAEPEKTTAKVTVDDVTLPDGTVVKGYDLSKSVGSKLTDDEISKMIDRNGYTPDKWTVTHLNDDGTVKSTTTMTTAELQEYFKNNAVTDDIIVSVPDDAKWTKNTSTKPASPSPTVTRSANPKTGDAPYLLIAGSTAIAAAGALLVLLALRRRRDSDEE